MSSCPSLIDWVFDMPETNGKRRRTEGRIGKGATEYEEEYAKGTRCKKVSS